MTCVLCDTSNMLVMTSKQWDKEMGLLECDSCSILLFISCVPICEPIPLTAVVHADGSFLVLSGLAALSM
jgi:hypothetical protein